MNNSFLNVDFTRTLPPILKKDKKMQALAQVIAVELQKTAGLIKRNIIYAGIDELPESVLDILAYDLNVDWYDFDYPVEYKRELIKTCIKINMKLGTVYAVETAVRAIYPESRVIEWFDYGGEPFCFKVVLNAGDKNIKINIDDMAKKIKKYKRLTAHLESINIEKTKKGIIYIVPIKEVFVKSNIKVNPYYKAMQMKTSINTSIHSLTYIRICYYKG